MKNVYLTENGINKFEKELEASYRYLYKVATKLKLAREEADRDDNLEWMEAKSEYDHTIRRISEIERMLCRVRSIVKPRGKNRVQLGSTVQLRRKTNVATYTVVGSEEANPAEGMISDQSPLGQELLGKRLNQRVEVTTPHGETARYKVMSIG